ncbi:MAG: NAD-dependent epimerase/dehydratase family protein [bacterium]
MNFWENKKVLVTGGAGFVGSHLVEMLVAQKAIVRIVDNLENSSLKNLGKVKGKIEFIKANLGDFERVKEVYKKQEVVFHLAAKVGGIEFNQLHLGTMFRDNVLINVNSLEAARKAGVERFLVISSACIYRRDCFIPTPEEEGFEGVPEPTNEGYGWAKRMAEVQGRLYAQEFGMKIGVVRPYNCYGPRDHFDPGKSHVIPALIKRIFDGENPLVVWGSGNQSRAFLYVEDFARGLVEAIEKYPVPDPINIGTDEEIKIKDLVNLLLKLSGKNPKVIFDASKPEGQPRRNCDTRKAKEKIGFEAKIRLSEGLKQTIEWYSNYF